MAAPLKAVGPKSDKMWRDAIMKAVRERKEGKSGPQQLAKLADKIVQKALEGDVSALREIGDRLDGKPAQAHQLEDKDGTQIPISFVMNVTGKDN